MNTIVSLVGAGVMGLLFLDIGCYLWLRHMKQTVSSRPSDCPAATEIGKRQGRRQTAIDEAEARLNTK